jgi:hypothetical protein
MFIDDPVSASSMRYVIFRGLTPQAPLRDIGQIAITGQGELTFTDDFSDLENPPPLDNTTWYYSVVAIADESISNNVQVAIARTPSAYAPGTMSFYDDVLPLFASIKNPSDATQNCLSCHSTGSAAGGMDLSTLEGILAGVGPPPTLTVSSSLSWEMILTLNSAHALLVAASLIKIVRGPITSIT